MELMKMTDFVLGEKGDNIKYAKFLKQKITLDMFYGNEALFLKTQRIKDIWGCLESYKNIEDLFNSGVNLFLTPHAIKQLDYERGIKKA